MLKILIVEDNNDKASDILKVITDAFHEIDLNSIKHVTDAHGAKKELEVNFYDLLIIDIAIPERLSQEVNQEGGIQLLEDLKLRDKYKMPQHIIGLTGYNNIFQKVKDKFEANVLSIIEYSNNNIEWSTKIKESIKLMIASKKSIHQKIIDYNFDIAIICAVEVEYNSVKAAFDNWNNLDISGDSTIYIETNINNYNDQKIKIVLAKLEQMGLVSSATMTMKVIQNFRPQYIIMPGIAASIQNERDHGYGDILVFDECWDGGAGKIKKDNNDQYIFEPVANHLRMDTDILNLFRRIQSDNNLLRNIKDTFQGKTPNTELKVHIGSVTSVAGVIANNDVTQQLKQKDRKLLGLEMEAYGMYFAAYNSSNPKPKPIALKSVCDFADSNKSDDYQHYSAYSSTNIMKELIKKL